jgi:hypothetical protein
MSVSSGINHLILSIPMKLESQLAQCMLRSRRPNLLKPYKIRIQKDRKIKADIHSKL